MMKKEPYSRRSIKSTRDMFPSMSEVSVIVPTYNRANVLPRALDSVLSQTYKDIELIVVDDNSDDDTRNVVESYSDPRIRYVRHEINQGANSARNTGIKEANGHYISFLDDDDEWFAEKINTQLTVLKQLDDSYGLAYSGRQIVKNGKVIEEYKPDLEGEVFRELLKENFIPSETPLIRYDCFESVGLFDERFRSCQDWDMWLRISQEYKISCVDEILAVSHWDSNDRISTNSRRKHQGYELILKKYSKHIKRNPQSLSHVLSRYIYYRLKSI